MELEEAPSVELPLLLHTPREMGSGALNGLSGQCGSAAANADDSRIGLHLHDLLAISGANMTDQKGIVVGGVELRSPVKGVARLICRGTECAHRQLHTLLSHLTVESSVITVRTANYSTGWVEEEQEEAVGENGITTKLVAVWGGKQNNERAKTITVGEQRKIPWKIGGWSGGMEFCDPTGGVDRGEFF